MNPKQSFISKLVEGIQNLGTLHYVAPKETMPAVPVQKIAKSIANNETGIVQGDPYSFSQPSGNKQYGRALGKYQVTEGELKSYAPKYLGQAISGNDFLASSTAQDKYIQGKIQHYSSLGYSPEQIADIHRRGVTNSSDPGSTTYQDPGYVNKFDQTFLNNN